MAKGSGCRRNCSRAAERAAQEETGTAVRTVEEMPMCRHANLIRTGVESCCMERQLCQIARLLDEQNRMLAELLNTVRGQ